MNDIMRHLNEMEIAILQVKQLLSKIETVNLILPQPSSDLNSFMQFINSAYPFVVLDTETTGLDDGEIVQIAIINQDGETLLDTLVCPSRPISADATRIHRITDDMVKDAPSWATVQEDVKAILDNYVNVVVYNAVYDRKMMHKSSERAGLPRTEWKQNNRWWCAMTAYAEFHGEFNSYRGNYKWQKLTTAAAAFQIDTTGAHGALKDCQMTLGVIDGMFECQAFSITADGLKAIEESNTYTDGNSE